MISHFPLAHAADFDGWRSGARRALAAKMKPGFVSWAPDQVQGSLFEEAPVSCPTGTVPTLQVPSAFVTLANQIVCHSEPQRFSLLYALLWRLQKDRHLLQNPADPLLARLERLARAVRRDAHKMTAFVRFQKAGESDDGIEQFVAWFEPDHHIVRYTAPFFARRFANMHWSMLTPLACAHWQGDTLSFSDGITKKQALKGDALEDDWRSYYANIFNPARLKFTAMQAEMPRKYWKNLPEAKLIPGLVANARAREKAMMAAPPGTPRPEMMADRQIAPIRGQTERKDISTLEDIEAALRQCRDCPLWMPATQAVPGRGPAHAPLVLVGEQPGDHEDIAGEPFVGPAGKLLDRTLDEAGIDRASVYLTNAVKHFKFEPRGKRRLHKRPSSDEIMHCRWWLQKEISLVKPRVIVALGASAIAGVLGHPAKVMEVRGAARRLPDGSTFLASVHPSFALRQRDAQSREQAQRLLRQDLELARQLLTR